MEQERDRQARYKAERERDEAKRKRDEAERKRDEAERKRDEAERKRDEAERKRLECQKKGVVRAFKWKFGVDLELPENWAEGRSYDELETIADIVFERANLQEALELLQ